MKIIIINTLYFPYAVGGAEISVQLLCERLVEHGHKVKVITLHDKAERETSIINGVDVVFLPLKNIYWPFDNIKRNKFSKLIWHLIDNYNFAMKNLISSEIKMFTPDVIHTNNLSGFSVSVWDAACSQGVKIVHTARDYYLFHPGTTLYKNGKNTNERSLSVFLWSFIKKWKSKKVNIFVGISDFIKKFHISNDFFNGCENLTIYNAVQPLSIRTVNSKNIRLGYIGKLSEAKGFTDFCEIISVLHKSHRNIYAVAAGNYITNDDIEKLENLASKAKIKMVGKISLLEFLNKVDIIILPIKWREPFGRVIVESALADKIVLTNPVGGVSELMKILPNVHLLSTENIIISLSLKEKSKISNDIKNKFEPMKIADEYNNVYERISIDS